MLIIDIRTQHIFLILVLLVGRALCCFECSSTALTNMRYLNYMIQEKHEDDKDANMKVLQFAKDALEDVKGQLKTKRLDHYGISQIGLEYQKCIDGIVHSKLKGDQLINLIRLRYKKLKEKFKNIVQQFQKRVCPNKQGEANCGIVIQAFTECVACEWEKTVCVGGLSAFQEWFKTCGCFCVSTSCSDMVTGKDCKPCEDFEDYLTMALFCGAKQLELTEGRDMKLDCSLEWHNKLEEPMKYLFQKFNSSKTQVYTDDSLFVKKTVNIMDSGGYSCIAMNFTGFPISMTTFQVKVFQEASTQAFATFPTVPAQTVFEVENLINTYAPIMAGVCSILIVLLLLGMCAYLHSRRESEQIRARIEKKNLEDMMEMIID